MTKLGRKFYSRHTVDVAKDLLGKALVRKLNDKVLKGIIVEVEAYRGSDDPASHAYRGLTKRNSIMFGKPGVAYVYFTYGNHYCLNIVTESEGCPGAVLLRALEPLSGLSYMMKLRGIKDVRNLTNGPGKITKAMKINSKHNGLDLTVSDELFIEEHPCSTEIDIASSPRIGIRKGTDKLWRFYIKGNQFVSSLR